MRKTLTYKIFNLLILVMIVLLQSFTAVSKEDNVINFYNWADYIGESTIRDFQKEYGIKVNYDQYDSSEIVEAKLLAGNSGYDLVVHSAMYSKRLTALNIFHEIEPEKLSNYKLLDPMLMKMLDEIDTGNRVMIPYSYGSTGVSYDANKIFARDPNPPIGSAAMLYEPDTLSKFADCGIIMLDSPTDVIPQALVYLGYDDSSKDPRELDEAEELLHGARPFIKKFTSTTLLNDLANGDACIAMSWAGDYATAKDRAEEAGKDIDLRYFVPEEGGLLWVDIIVIPKDAKNIENAYLLLDYLLRPEVSADFVNLTHYASPVPNAKNFIKEEVVSDPAVYPTPEIMDRLFFTEVDPPKYSRIKTRIFSRFKTGIKKRESE